MFLKNTGRAPCLVPVAEHSTRKVPPQRRPGFFLLFPRPLMEFIFIDTLSGSTWSDRQSNVAEYIQTSSEVPNNIFKLAQKQNANQCRLVRIRVIWVYFFTPAISLATVFSTSWSFHVSLKEAQRRYTCSSSFPLTPTFMVHQNSANGGHKIYMQIGTQLEFLVLFSKDRPRRTFFGAERWMV